MTVLTESLRELFAEAVTTGRIDDRLDALLDLVEDVELRAASRPAAPRILTGNADLTQPEHDAHIRAMEAREAVRRG